MFLMRIFVEVYCFFVDYYVSCILLKNLIKKMKFKRKVFENFKKIKIKNKTKSFGLRGIGPSSHFNSFSKNIYIYIVTFFQNPFYSFKDPNIFPKPPFQRLQFFFKSLLFKRIQEDPFDKTFSKS